MPYVTSEMSQILQRVESDTGDQALVQSIHFSSTALTFIRRLAAAGGIIIADTMLTLTGADTDRLRELGLTLACYIEDPDVLAAAEKRHVTRAEIAVDYALSLSGLKLFLVGSAPMALSRLLACHQLSPLKDVGVIAAPAGYASVVQLKERLWESGLPVVVARGRKGGAAAAVAMLDAVLSETALTNR